MPVIYASKEATDNLRPRIDKDVYQTPTDLACQSIELVVDLYPKLYMPLDIDVLDPGAGNGVWGMALSNFYRTSQITGLDIRRLLPNSNYGYWFPRTNYLTWTPNLEFDLITGNPPFNLAEKFILRSRELLSEKGVLCFLLPSQFQHGQKRGRGLFREYAPEYIVSLLQRPNFTGPKGESLGNANTDDYILMIWTKDSKSNLVTRHLWLDWRE